MSETLPKIDFITERVKLCASREQTIDILIRITPPELDQERSYRPTLNLSLVIDRSGSMQGIKMQRARDAAMYCVDQLLPTDRLGVVVFDEEIGVLFPNQLVTNKPMMKDMLARINARGTTALHEAWVRGGMEVSENLLSEGINRVILITDGQANVGVTDTDQIVSQAMELFKRGVSTSTIGIGDDFNEDLLLPMAQSAGGNAWHVEKPDDMQRIFQVELEGLVAQFAHLVTLGLVPADGVRIVDFLNDFELTETGRYRLPNLQAGSPLDLVVSLRIPAQEAGKSLRLLDLRLGMTRQEASSAEVLKQAFTIDFVDKSEYEKLPVNHELAKSRQLLMNARARREAMNRMDSGDVVGAQQILAHAVSATRVACAPLGDAPEVLEECAELEGLGKSLLSQSVFKLNRKKLAYSADARRRGKG